MFKILLLKLKIMFLPLLLMTFKNMFPKILKIMFMKCQKLYASFKKMIVCV